MKKYLCMAAIMALAAAGDARGAWSEISLTVEAPQIYPGAVHRITVTVPEACRPEWSAPLFVGLDGTMGCIPAILDSLEAAGTIRPTVGVFVEPGEVPSPLARKEPVRFNRSNEFDATDDRFARFLAEIVLPKVMDLRIDDPREPDVLKRELLPVRVSADPRERIIFGHSSGGIAAFTAAWHRPDLFGCVYAACGTFVPFRGGDEWPALVRKHEPKPLRVFMQDGVDDTWNPLFGSWYEANRMMASALEFAGYPVKFLRTQSGHSREPALEALPQAIEWLLSSSDGPRATANDFLAPCLEGAGAWEYSPRTGADDALPAPTVLYPDGTLEVRQVPGSHWLEQSVVLPTGERRYAQRFYWLHSYDRSDLALGGMAFDGAGCLWVVTSAGVQVCDQNGRVRGIFALPDGFEASRTCIAVSDGKVRLSSPDGLCMVRRLGVRGARKGVAPASQGAG